MRFESKGVVTFSGRNYGAAKIVIKESEYKYTERSR
jgi:hypothetical protein